MSRKEPHITFSAYTGTEDLPEDFAGVRADGSRSSAMQSKTEAEGHGVRPRRKLRLTLLALLLVTVSGVVFHQREGALPGAFSEVVSLDFSGFNWPQMPSSDGPLFNRPVGTVRIESTVRRISEAEIRSVLAHHIDDGFIGIDVMRVKLELEANPWVEHASVRRVWPDALAVSVTEQQPIARWGDTELLNPYAERFRPDNIDEVERLPVLRGPASQEESMMRQYQQFSRMLLPVGLRITALTLSERGSWSLETDNGMRLEIGRDAPTERMQRFITLYDRALYRQADEIGVIDLRYRNGMAVRSRETGTGEVASL